MPHSDASCQECGQLSPFHSPFCHRIPPRLDVLEAQRELNAELKVENAKLLDSILLLNQEIDRLRDYPEEVRLLKLQVDEVWSLLETMPSGPGEGLVSTGDDAKAAEDWATRYNAAKVKWKRGKQQKECGDPIGRCYCGGCVM